MYTDNFAKAKGLFAYSTPGNKHLQWVYMHSSAHRVAAGEKGFGGNTSIRLAALEKRSHSDMMSKRIDVIRLQDFF